MKHLNTSGEEENLKDMEDILNIARDKGCVIPPSDKVASSLTNTYT